MKTNRILAILITAFYFVASKPCFSDVKLLSGDEDSGVVKITSKELSSADAKKMGIVIVASKLDDDEISITLELKKEGMLKHFSSFRLSLRDGGKAVFEGELNSKLSSKPDSAFAVFIIRRSLLPNARLSVHSDDERDQGNGQYDDVHVGLYVLNLREHVPAVLLPKVQTPGTDATNSDGRSEGLAFLADFPSLEGVSLKMSEAEFLNIVTKQKLSFEKDASGEKASYHVHAKKDATIYFGFQQGKCTGIQRMRD